MAFQGYLARKCTRAIQNKLHKRCSSAGAAQLKEIIDAQLEGIKEAGTWKSERIITSKQAAEINVAGREGKLLNFCANNYLGLSAHPSVMQAAKDTTDKYGAGLSSVRFICGTQDIHKQLEQKVAKFHGREDAILYIACYDANCGLFETILNEEDAVFSDALNHASMIDGIRLCRAKKYRYKHMDLNELEAQLKDAEGRRLKLIATDGCFSMDGNIAPLNEICDLADKYGAITMIDECHATGFLGKTGRGTEDYLNCMGRVTIINSTLGKALGGASGGYTTGPKEVVELLRQKSRPYLFSNAMPPGIVGSAIKVLDMLMESNDLIEKLQQNTKLFRTKMTEAGFTLSGVAHPISPVMLGDARLAVEFGDEMLDRGIYVVGFTFPVVPKGTARIRVQLSAAHSTEDIEKCIDAFIDIGRKKGVIS